MKGKSNADDDDVEADADDAGDDDVFDELLNERK